MAEKDSSVAASLAVGLVVASSLGLGATLLLAGPKREHVERFGPLDIEALGRMFSSENPRGSERLKIEQAWTQLRSRKAGQSLYERVTAGSGWGPQGERAAVGGIRPVSTRSPASPADLSLAQRILAGMAESILPGARQFFEPAQQDQLFLLAKAAKDKQDAGKPLTDREKHLLRYKSDAAQIRRRWSEQGSQRVDEIDGVEFWT